MATSSSASPSPYVTLSVASSSYMDSSSYVAPVSSAILNSSGSEVYAPLFTGVAAKRGVGFRAGVGVFGLVLGLVL